MRKTGKALQRLLSAFVTACVLITCVSGLQPASAASIEPGAAAYVTAGETGKNLFSDGSFEAVGKEGFKDYTSTWDFYWFPPLSNGGTMESQAAYVVKDPAGAHDGDYYIKNDQTGWFGIAEPTVELAAGEYEFSAWVRAAEGTLRVNLTIGEGLRAAWWRPTRWAPRWIFPKVPAGGSSKCGSRSTSRAPTGFA